ncbi:MAG: glycosyltransferase [Patescibacteria group bacterium]
MKVIIIINFISPIRVFLFNKLNTYFSNKNQELKVLFLSETDKNRNWEREKNIEFQYEILDNFAIRSKRKDLNTFFINPKINKLLNKENPDKIICFGWDHFVAYAANRWARKNQKEFVLWSGSTINEKSWRRTVFNPLVKYLVKRTNHFIAYGTRAKEYLIILGAAEQNIEIFYNTIDIDYFQKEIKNFSETKKQDLKNKLGITSSKVILFNGQLIERKGIFELLEGYNQYKQKDSDISLLMIGGGQEKTRINRTINEGDIKDVILVDFIQYRNVYKYYAISDMLILPSREEVWGLVINEALACGLPVITTNKVGASADLVENGKNGYIIKVNCSDCINKAISLIFKNNLHIQNNSKKVLCKTKVEKQWKII